MFEACHVTWIPIIGKYGWRKFQSLELAGRNTRFAIVLLAAIVGSCSSPPNVLADTHYVSLSGGNVSPYTSWATAATNIQYAIDVSTNGDTVLVTNGVYATGGRVVFSNMPNRIAITNGITVRSVNGPTVTAIQGQGPYGSNAVRCAFIGNNALLAGFTLTNGATHSMGDAVNERSGGGAWCASSASISNCVLTGNSSYNGGGTYYGVLNCCTLLGNTANNIGGGAYYGTFSNCILSGNSTSGHGGGSYFGTFNNCILSWNTATMYGGGVYGGTLKNCTLFGNRSFLGGGGVYNSTLYNSIIYFNMAPAAVNCFGSTLNYCCATPMPVGTGNITNDPVMDCSGHLCMNSPCIRAGSSSYSGGTDIDGETWTNPPSMGCDEVHAGSSTGTLGVAVTASVTNAATGFGVDFTGYITGRTSVIVWTFGDGSATSNSSFVTTHAYAAPGRYDVVFTVTNESYTSGVSATAIVSVVARPIHFVNVSNPTPSAPFATWTSAATNIQDAVDVAMVPGSLVLVSNGIYDRGGRVAYGGMTNRVAITNAVTVQSVNGPAVTSIVGSADPISTNGNAAIRCVYLGTNASLTGFTLANGHSRSTDNGGGVWCLSEAIVSNCTLSGNSAAYGGGSYYGILNNCLLQGNAARYGGGSYYSTLNNCTLSSNSANYGGGADFATLNNCLLYGNVAITYGGGSCWCMLNNCTLVGNSAATNGGGSYSDVLENCIIYSNAAAIGSNYYSSTLSYCCTVPAASGTGNIENDPKLVNASGGDYHLSATSPCINAGTNETWIIGAVDLDGRPRIIANSVDIGAYEYVDAAIVDITNSAVVVSYSITNYTIGGTKNQFVVGTMLWTNGANGASSPFAATNPWLAVNIPLAVGTNLITVLGTNIAGEVASDNVTITRSINVPDAFVDITNTAFAVGYSVTNYTIGGTNNQYVVGSMWWTNAANGAGNMFAATNPWQVVNIPLAVGTNLITVFGTNITGIVASDSVIITRSNTLAAFVDITNVAAAVDFSVANYTIGGTNNQFVVGLMWWTNRANGTRGTFASNNPWQVVDIPLAVGTNLITVYGTNIAGVSASDNVSIIRSNRTEAITLYVWTDSPAPASPFTNWITAARTIQEAVDASIRGDTVTVTDGVYATGGRAVYGSMTNRVAITNAISVRSVNGPLVTTILGKDPMTNDAVRCAYVGTNATLAGFTLTGGATLAAANTNDGSGGGVWCITNAVVSNCVIVGNSAMYSGGGAYQGWLFNCRLSGNSAGLYGGGSAFSILRNCSLSDNYSLGSAGGSYNGTLNNCTLSGNLANYLGGGVHVCSLNNCIVYFNSAPSAANCSGSALNSSCTTPLVPGVGNITNDPALASAMHLTAMSPCVGTGNSNSVDGVDIDDEVWASPPSMGCDEVHTGAITGSLGAGIGVSSTNISVGYDVEFTGYITGLVTRLIWDFGDGQVTSNASFVIKHSYSTTGSFNVVLTVINESFPGGVSVTAGVSIVTRPIHYVSLSNSTPLAPFTTWVTAATNIQDALDMAIIPGAIVLVSNGVYATGGRIVAGTTTTNRVVVTNGVTVRSVNGSTMTSIVGVADPLSTNGNAAIRCVYLGPNAVLTGFTLTNGHTTAADYGGGVLCLPGAVASNCILARNSAYIGGGARNGTLNNCALISGDSYQGGGASYSVLNNCVLSGNRASWSGGAVDHCVVNNSTLSANSASLGGGAWYSTLNNCMLSGNAANSGSAGGSYAGWLFSCVLRANFAGNFGGAGAGGASFVNCTLVGNSAGISGGGAHDSTLTNCISYFNTAPSNANHNISSLSYCCTTPLPSGTGNIASDPQFSDITVSNYDLRSSSPCIDVGMNESWMTNAMDIAGHARVLNGRADIGAYEFSFQSSLKALLAGAWDATAGAMRAGGPLVNCPYKAAIVSVTNVPANAVDWVLVSVRENPTSGPVASVSAFMMPDGTIRGADGGTNVYVEAKGNLYGVLQHRNHLAVMSAAPIFTNRYVQFDFSADPNLLWGGTNAVIQVSTNRWGMIPGDADSDGEIGVPDILIHKIQAP